MSVVVGYRNTTEGRAGLRAAVVAARTRGDHLVVIDLARERGTSTPQLDAASQQELDELVVAGGAVDLRQPGPGPTRRTRC